MNSDNTRLKKQEIHALLQAGMATDAKTMCTELCRNNAHDAELWLLLAAINAQLALYEETVDACRKVIAIDPDHAAARYNLGVALQVLNRPDEAANEYRQLVEMDPAHAAAYNNLGQALRAQGMSMDAVNYFRKAASLEPGRADILNNLGLALTDQNMLDEATAVFERLIAAGKDTPETHNQLGVVMLKLSRHSEAEAHFRHALQLEDGNAAFHFNLGNLYIAQSRLPEATVEYETAVKLNPASEEAWTNLGQVTEKQGDTRKAINHYRRGLSSCPASAALNNNLAYLLWLTGARAEALGPALRAVQLAPDKRLFRQTLAQIIQSIPDLHPARDLINEIETTLTYRGIDHQSLARPCLDLLAHNEDIKNLLERSEESNIQTLAGEIGSGIHDDALHNRLLITVLHETVACDLRFEHMFRKLRHAFMILASATDNDSVITVYTRLKDFLSALACQCFNNEYVYLQGSDEAAAADDLIDSAGDRLVDCRELGDDLLFHLSVACMYTPLYRIRHHETLLAVCSPTGADGLQKLVSRQLLEPLADLDLRGQVESITQIDDTTSRSVADQYESLPYPRWLDVNLHTPRPWRDVIRGMFEHYQPSNTIPDNPHILVAGCGSGRHAIMTATRFEGADVLAVDLSKSSLAYAQRMADKLGIGNIRFAQADILKLDNIGQTFDIIESVGVLHHMEKPESGLARLLDQLRPGGLINIGLYSKQARTPIIAAQKYFRDRGYTARQSDMRKAREDIFALDKTDPMYKLTGIQDFFSLSEFCDLAFHAREVCYTLPEVADILARADLRFIGFDLSDPAVRQRYRQLYPEDSTLTNLVNWNAFEIRYPDTFIEMYTFWSEIA